MIKVSIPDSINLDLPLFSCSSQLSQIYLTKEKTNFLQYYLTQVLMLFYHSYQIKSMNLWSQYQGNILLVQIKQSR